VHIQQDGNEILSDGFADNVALIVRGELEEFLAQIVAEWVRHQFGKVTEHFTEDHVAKTGEEMASGPVCGDM
jgi:hypothetical protein